MAPVNRNWKTLTEPCYNASKAIGGYFNSLRLAALLPYDLEFTEHRFYDLIEKALKLPKVSISKYSCSDYGCQCKNEPTYNLSRDLQQAARTLNQQCKTFICLDCLKSDGSSKDQGKCRISHS